MTVARPRAAPALAWFTIVAPAAAALLVNAAAWAWWSWSPRAGTAIGPVVCVVVAGVFPILAGLMHHLWRCGRPARQFAVLVEQARLGLLPIDALSDVATAHPSFAPVVDVVQRLLRDLRQDRAERAALARDCSERVAHHTDVLERKIGSLKAQATRDPLTGLSNRRALEATLPPAVDRYRQGAGPALCLLMIDVDHFKPLNDTLGHAAGDDLLRAIGQILRSTIGEGDQAYRCGGDEFLVVMEGQDHRAATATARRLESLVETLTRTLRVPLPPRLSIGVVGSCELPAPSAEQLLALADQRLYAVKATRPRTRRSA